VRPWCEKERVDINLPSNGVGGEGSARSEKKSELEKRESKTSLFVKHRSREKEKTPAPSM